MFFCGAAGFLNLNPATMRKFYLMVTCFCLFSCAAKQKAVTRSDTIGSAGAWSLIFKDDFTSSGRFDSSKWTFCKRNGAPWARYLTAGPEHAFGDGKDLVLRMDNKQMPGDDVPYHSGGVETKGKFSFTYGKVEVRARFSGGRGSWPAIWMMPENDAYGGWPNSGEIDIMEHVNNEKEVHQTIHNAAVTGASGGSLATKSSKYNAGDYNIYGIVWSGNKIEFFVNNVLRFSYHKPANASSRAWPFDQPFYLILNQSGGAGWPGPVTDADLPFTMYVDWVRVYQQKN
jgi:beta-glucanase (GH16 family)